MGEQELFTLDRRDHRRDDRGQERSRRGWTFPDAIVLVVLGVLASLIPQVPNIELSPSLVLLVFLPPLVYNAAFFSAPRETRENAVPITALAIGATALTIVAVGLGDQAGDLPDLPTGGGARVRRPGGADGRRGRHVCAESSRRASSASSPSWKARA